MADPKATVFQGQEGSGFAQIFQGGPDAYTTMRQPVRDLIELEFTRAKEARAKEEAQKAAFAKLADFNPYFEQFQAELERDYEGMGGTFVEAYSRGVNPEDPTNPVGQQFGKQKADFSRKKEIAKQLFDEYGKQQEALKPGDFDAEHFAKTWEQALQKGSITDTFEFLRNSTPLVKKIDLFEGIDKFIPESHIDEVRVGGEYVTTTAPKAEDLDFQAKMYAVAKPEQVQSMIDRGLAKDYDEAVALIREKIEDETIKSVTRQPVPKSGDINIGVGGVAAPEDVNVAGKSVWSEGGKVDEINVKFKNKDITPMEIIDRNDDVIYFKPSTFYKVHPNTTSGLTPGTWAVKGVVMQRTGEQKVSAEEANKYRGRPNFEVIDNADGTSTVTKFVPLRDEVVSYDKNDIRFQTALDGLDINEWAEKWNAKNAKGQPAQKQSASKATSKGIPADDFRKLSISERTKYKRNADGTYSLK